MKNLNCKQIKIFIYLKIIEEDKSKKKNILFLNLKKFCFVH